MSKKKLYGAEGNEVKGAKIKKPFYKRWWFIALAAIVIISAIGGGGGDDAPADDPEVAEIVEDVEADEPQSAEETEEEIEKESEEVEEEIEESTSPETEVSEPISTEEKTTLPPELALSLMEQNFQGIANVTYNSESKAFLIDPTDPELTSALILLLEGSTPEINESWEVLKNSFVSASDALKESVGTGYQIHLLNPMNNENTLLVIIDGIVMYDAFAQ